MIFAVVEFGVPRKSVI